MSNNEVLKVLNRSGININYRIVERMDRYDKKRTYSVVSIIKRNGEDIHKVIGSGDINTKEIKMNIVRQKRLDKEVVSLQLSRGGMKTHLLKLGVNRVYGNFQG